MTDTIQKINIDSITSGDTTGEGDWDITCKSIMSQIGKYVDAGILDKDAATELVASTLNESLKTITQFTLNKDAQYYAAKVQQSQSEMNQEQKNLLIAQTADVEADTRRKDYEYDNFLPLELETKQKNLTLLDSKISLSQKQEDQIDAQIQLTQAQVALAQQQLETGLIQQDLLTEQVNTAKAQTKLLDQQLVTETAQTDSTALSGWAASSDVLEFNNGGVLGSQVSLTARQKKSFKLDGYQKYAQIYNQSFVSQMTTLGAYTQLDTAKQDATDIGTAMAYLKAETTDTPFVAPPAPTAE